jgi:hypothetical protein
MRFWLSNIGVVVLFGYLVWELQQHKQLFVDQEEEIIEVTMTADDSEDVPSLQFFDTLCYSSIWHEEIQIKVVQFCELSCPSTSSKRTLITELYILFKQFRIGHFRS